MGNDTVFNFVTGADQIDITSLLNIKANATNTPIQVTNHAVATANAVLVQDGGNHLTAANGGGSYATGYTVKDFVAWGNAASAAGWGNVGETGVYFLRDNDTSNAAGLTNKYTVFRVVEDSAAALTEAEVTLLGTITLDNTHAVIAAGDFYVYS